MALRLSGLQRLRVHQAINISHLLLFRTLRNRYQTLPDSLDSTSATPSAYSFNKARFTV